MLIPANIPDMFRTDKLLPIKYFFVLAILLTACESAREPYRLEGRLLPVEADFFPATDPPTDSIIELYRLALETEMNQVLAISDQVMRRGSPEGLLNNFVADLILDMGQRLYDPTDGQPIDFCLLNYGGLRTSIPEGPVTRSNIFELMPFENEMVVLELSPEKTWALFEFLAAHERGMPVSNLSLVIADGKPQEVKIGGEAFDPQRNYKVLTSDYLAGGGDHMTFLLDPIHSEMLGMRIRDAIIAHLKEQQALGQRIRSQLDGRIREINNQ